MSSCTFLLIHKGKVALISAHYSCLANFLGGFDLPSFESSRVDLLYSDTGAFPAFILDFDNKKVAQTDFNWFIGFDSDKIAPLIIKYGWKVATKDGVFDE